MTFLKVTIQSLSDSGRTLSNNLARAPTTPTRSVYITLTRSCARTCLTINHTSRQSIQSVSATSNKFNSWQCEFHYKWTNVGGTDMRWVVCGHSAHSPSSAPSDSISCNPQALPSTLTCSIRCAHSWLFHQMCTLVCSIRIWLRVLYVPSGIYYNISQCIYSY